MINLLILYHIIPKNGWQNSNHIISCLILISFLIFHWFYMLFFTTSFDILILTIYLLIVLMLPILIISADNILYRDLLMITCYISLMIIMSKDFLTFFITYELLLIPLTYLFLNYSTHNLKRKALTMMLLYTLFGSITLWLNLYWILWLYKTWDYSLIIGQSIDINANILINIGFLLAFLVKIPTYPFHLWLPAAHVEASKLLSIYLASILLKLGYYGIYRFNYQLFPDGFYWLLPILNLLSIISVIYANLICFTLIDIKKIIAYSSIAHMNLTIITMISNISANINIYSSLLYLISHGIISTGLFYNMGILYDRYHTRNLLYYKGLTQTYPIFALFIGIFLFGNLAFPLTSGFICEFIIFQNILTMNNIFNIILFICIILTGVYNILLLHKIIYGKISKHLLIFSDISLKDVNINIYLTFLMIYFGTFGLGLLGSIE